MALLTVRTVGATASAFNLVAVNSTDAISSEAIGTRGVILDVNNGGGGSITVSISDPGATPAGNPGTVTAQTLTTGLRRQFYVGPANINPATGVATVTYSGTTTVTAEAYRY